MPSASHEAVIDLFRERPALGPMVLQAATDIVPPPQARARVTAAQFSDLAPPAYQADAVLSAVAHGRAPGAARLALAALAGCATLDRRRSALYADFVLAHLGKAARTALEGFMRIEGYEYQSDFAKKYVEQGREEGRRDGLAAMLIRQLEQRFGSLPEPIATTIHAADAGEILRWGERVLTAGSLAEVFADAP